MINMSEIASYVGLGFWGITALLVLIGALKGRSRGICRQGVRFGTIVLSILIAFFATKISFNTMCSFIEQNGMAGILDILESNGMGSIDEETKKLIVHISPSTVNLVLAIPMALLILPLMFTTTFVLVSAIMLIVHAIICKIAKISKAKDSDTKNTRLYGAILGAVQGFIVAVVFFLPFTGPLGMASDAMADLKSSGSNSDVTAEITEVYDEYIEPISDNSAVKVLGGAGGKFLYRQIGTVKIGGQKYKIADDVVSPTFKLIGSISAITNIDFENISEDDKVALDALIDVVIDSSYMRSLIAHVLDDLATACSEGDIDAINNETVQSIISVFVGMDENKVKATLELVRDAIFIVGVDFENITEDDKASIQALIDSIENDTYKKELLADILSAVATVLSEQNSGEDGELLGAVLSVFIDIDPELIAPALDLIVDASFLMDTEELGENEINILIDSVKDDDRKSEMLAKILDAVATALENEESEEGDMLSAIVGVFKGLQSEEVVPTLELIRDALFMVDMDWENVTEEDEANIDALIASAKPDEIKANMLAKILDAVATMLNDDESTDPLVSAVISVFIDIDGPSVVPALEVMRDSMFMIEVDWNEITEEQEEQLDSLIIDAKTEPKKAEILAEMLDAFEESYEGSDMVSAVLSVFDGIKASEVAPTLEVMRDSLFLTNIDWEDISEENEQDLDHLIAIASNNTTKADVLAKMLNAVSAEIDTEDGLVNAILSIFDGIEGEYVAPTLEVIRDSLFIADMEWSAMTDDDKANLNVLIDGAKADTKKAEVLATMLDAVSDELDNGSSDDDFVNAMLSVFKDIEAEKVAPTLEVVRDAMFMANAEDWKNDIPTEDREALDALIASADANETKAEVLATILDSLADEFDNQTGNDATVTEELMESLFSVFDGATKDDVVPTLSVVRDVLFMLDDENAMATLSSNPASLTDVFSKKDENDELLIDRVIGKLKTNDNTKPLVSSFTKISITIMAEKANEGTGTSVEVTEETYENVKTGVQDIVNINQNHNAADLVQGTEEYDNYVSDVSDALSSTFTDNGFEVEKDVVDEMANYVAENYKDNADELTEDEVNDIILNYYSSYLQSGTLPTP